MNRKAGKAGHPPFWYCRCFFGKWVSTIRHLQHLPASGSFWSLLRDDACGSTISAWQVDRFRARNTKDMAKPGFTHLRQAADANAAWAPAGKLPASICENSGCPEMVRRKRTLTGVLFVRIFRKAHIVQFRIIVGVIFVFAEELAFDPFTERTLLPARFTALGSVIVFTFAGRLCIGTEIAAASFRACGPSTIHRIWCKIGTTERWSWRK